jgi:hypothetical protein
MQRFDIPHRKQLRSESIRQYLELMQIKKVVIFSCGNASETLKMMIPDCDILDISPDGMLAPTNKWWSKKEIKDMWPDRFDATSGHLPELIMLHITKLLLASPLTWLPFIPMQGKAYEVPTGSGETIVCLRQAYPNVIFEPVYNISVGTQYNQEAPLNKQVREGSAFNIKGE